MWKSKWSLVSKAINHLSRDASAARSSLDAIDRNASLMSFISRLWASLSDQICASSPAKRRHRSGKPLDDKFHHCKHATS